MPHFAETANFYATLTLIHLCSAAVQTALSRAQRNLFRDFYLNMWPIVWRMCVVLGVFVTVLVAENNTSSSTQSPDVISRASDSPPNNTTGQSDTHWRPLSTSLSAHWSLCGVTVNNVLTAGALLQFIISKRKWTVVHVNTMQLLFVWYGDGAGDKRPRAAAMRPVVKLIWPLV